LSLPDEVIQKEQSVTKIIPSSRIITWPIQEG